MTGVQLRALSVRNLRSYESAQAQFPPGTTLLVGDVGAGKTSLLHAIEMALFGFAEVAPEHLIRLRSREAEVSLGLGDGEHRYEFHRRFRRKSVRGKATFETMGSDYSEDGRRATYPATELRQRAIDLLGFPDDPNPKAHSDVWRWAVYIPQEQMREVLSQAPEGRLETVRKALGIEQYRTAAENAGDLANELRQRAEAIEEKSVELQGADEALGVAKDEERVAEEEGARLRTDEPTSRHALADADEVLATSLREVARLESDRRLRDRLLTEIRAAETDREARRRRLESARKRASELRAEADRAEVDAVSMGRGVRARESVSMELHGVDQRRVELEESARELSADRARLVEAGRREAEFRTESERLAIEIQQANDSRNRVEAELPREPPSAPTQKSTGDLRAEVAQLRESLDSAVREMTRAEQVAAELEDLLRQGNCPRCHQPVRAETFGSHAVEARGELEQARAKHTATADHLHAVEAEFQERSRFDAANEAWTSGTLRRTELRGNLDRMSERARALASSQTEAQRELRGLEAKIAELGAVLEGQPAVVEQRRLLEKELERIAQSESQQEQLRERARGSRVRAEQTDREAEQHATDESGITRRITEAQAELSLVESRLAGAQAIQATAGNAAIQRDQARLALETLVGRLRELEHASTEAKRRREEAESRVERRRTLKAQAAHTFALASWIRGAFRVGLLELEKRRLSSALEQFNEALSRNFTSLLDDPALVARCDPYFTPLVDLEGEPTPAEALSGGERTALALAFRLAMGEIVRAAGRLRLDTLVLDEPTDGFSPEQVLRLGELLSKLSVGQLLLVTHERQLEAFVDHVIQVEKVEGRSHLTVKDDGPSARPSEAGLQGSMEAPAPQ